MNEQNELCVERKLELEEEIVKCYKEGTDLSELLLRYDLTSSKYLIEAIYMPINEIAKHIYTYDTSRPKIDELVFITELSQRYRVDIKDIINRIKDVRIIKQLNLHRQSKNEVKTRIKK